MLELVHTDSISAMRTLSKGVAKYVLTFVEEKSRYIVAYVMEKRVRWLVNGRSLNGCALEVSALIQRSENFEHDVRRDLHSERHHAPANGTV